jgi:hypothetical protein
MSTSGVSYAFVGSVLAITLTADLAYWYASRQGYLDVGVHYSPPISIAEYPDEGPGPAPARDLVGDLDHLKSELDAMRGELRNVLLRLTDRALGPAPTVEAVPNSTDEPVPPQRELDFSQRQSEAYGFIEAALSEEPVDPLWARETDETIRAAITSADFSGTTIEALECHSRLCRLQVGHESERNYEDFSEQFPLRVAQQLPSTVLQTIENADGTRTTVVYMARDGFHWPVAAQ